MAEQSLPFDAAGAAGTGGQASVLEGEWQRMGRSWLASGAVAGHADSGGLVAVTASGAAMSVTLATGVGWVEGFLYRNDAAATLAIGAADATNPRIDTVVLRLDRAANNVRAVVIAGAPAATPTAPALTQTDLLWELPLANVRVDAAVGTIAAGAVTDRRVMTGPGYSRGVADARFLGIGAKAADSDLLDGIDGAAFAQRGADNLMSGFNNFNRGALGTAAGDTRDAQNVAAGTTTNLVRLLARLVRTAAGNDHTTAAIDLIRVTDAASQAFLRWLGDRVQAHGALFHVIGDLLVNGGVSAARHRVVDSHVNTVESTTSTTYVGLPTADVVPFVGPPSGVVWLVWFATMANNTAGAISFVSADVVRVSDGAVIAAAGDDRSAIKPQTGDQTHGTSRRVDLVAGVEYRARLQYRVSGGTGSFYRRTLNAFPAL